MAFSWTQGWQNASFLDWDDWSLSSYVFSSFDFFLKWFISVVLDTIVLEEKKTINSFISLSDFILGIHLFIIRSFLLLFCNSKKAILNLSEFKKMIHIKISYRKSIIIYILSILRHNLFNWYESNVFLQQNIFKLKRHSFVDVFCFSSMFDIS